MTSYSKHQHWAGFNEHVYLPEYAEIQKNNTRNIYKNMQDG